MPYLREPQDCLHPDHPARRVTARWAAQLGKSTAIENWFGYIVDQAPGSMMIVLPTLEEATKFNRVKLQPTIEASPRIAHKVKPVNSRDEQGSTTAFKRFAGGFCQIVNAGSSKGLQMVSIKYLAMDEVTGYPKPPECCLVNLYRAGAKMGLHQDRDEQARDAPVLSVSLGDDALFRIGGDTRKGPTSSVKLSSGDVLTFGGAARMAYHGIDKVIAGSSTLVPGGGRINLTLRRVN